MYNAAYNIGYNYLKDKYGYERSTTTCSFDDKLRKCRNIEGRKELMAKSTDRDWNLRIKYPEKLPKLDETIKVLLDTINHSLSISPQKELWQLLVAMGLISKDLDPMKN